MTGSDLIAAERQRQITQEGWSVDHDREHGAHLLVRAGNAYATGRSQWWPFDNGTSFKPKGPLRNLVRAGALYQAAADVAAEDDTWSFASREKCEGYRDECADQIDALIAEVLAVLDTDRQRAEPWWCPEHGYGCEPQNCPCGHSLRCDCAAIAHEH